MARLRVNAVPEIEGVYNCYLDPVSARQLFSDPDFKQLFQGATSANQVFRKGMTNDFLGLRFMPTTEVFVQPHPTSPNVMIRRPIICGAGALIEGDFAGMAADDVAPSDSIVTMVDGVAMVTREPIDRLQQIIAQSWYWMGGFCAPSDTTTNPTTVPTATNASYKRAIIVEACRLIRKVSHIVHWSSHAILTSSNCRCRASDTASTNVQLAGSGEALLITNPTASLAYVPVSFGSHRAGNRGGYSCSAEQ